MAGGRQRYVRRLAGVLAALVLPLATATAAAAEVSPAGAADPPPAGDARGGGPPPSPGDGAPVADPPPADTPPAAPAPPDPTPPGPGPSEPPAAPQPPGGPPPSEAAPVPSTTLPPVDAGPLVAPPPSGAPVLEVIPGTSSSLTGENLTLTAVVSGAPSEGVEVDFEITQGPGDDDVGTPGDTPESPDMTCHTGAAAGPSLVASCSVNYAEGDNTGGVDAIRAWVPAEGQPPADGVCSGAGHLPDGSVCVVHEWIRREPTFLDVSPEEGFGLAGQNHTLFAEVFDQDGNPLVGDGTDTTVNFAFLWGPSLGVQPDLTCDTGTSGACAVTYHGSAPGTDVICGMIAGAGGDCSEPSDAPERDDATDVVTMTWFEVALDVQPKLSASPAGTPFTLIASVILPWGDGVDGVSVHFEVTSGPGRDALGGATSPHLSCLTTGGGPGVASSCAVSYSVPATVKGTDSILAWVDFDGDPATVAAAAMGGRTQSNVQPSCEPGTPGDGFDAAVNECVQHDWTAPHPGVAEPPPLPPSDRDIGATVAPVALPSAPVAAPTAPLESRPAAQRARAQSAEDHDGSVAGTIGKVAGALGGGAAFPFVLLVVLGVYLWFQNRIDRRDPKLSVTPSDAHQELDFE